MLPRRMVLVHVLVDGVADDAHGLGSDGRGEEPLLHHPLVVVTQGGGNYHERLREEE